MKGTILGLAVLAAGCGTTGLAATGAGVTVTTSPSASHSSSAIRQYAIGDAAHVTDNGSPAATVAVVSLSRATTPLTDYASGPANGQFASFTVIVTAADGITQPFSVNPGDFYVLEGSTHFDGTAGNAIENEPPNALQLASLGRSERTSGVLLFDVPAGHGWLVYSPNLNGLPLAEWAF